MLSVSAVASSQSAQQGTTWQLPPLAASVRMAHSAAQLTAQAALALVQRLARSLVRTGPVVSVAATSKAKPVLAVGPHSQMGTACIANEYDITTESSMAITK